MNEEKPNKINVDDVEELSWTSPKGTFAGFGKQISEALGRDPFSTDLQQRHPFDVELLRVPPGKKPYPYHSHSAQWEFYIVVSGSGVSRDTDGEHPVRAGDVFVYKPGEPHQLTNDGDRDLIVYVIADNPIGESAYYPDSHKWSIRSPERKLVREGNQDYFDGEE